jgi:hypothetical protein
MVMVVIVIKVSIVKSIYIMYLLFFKKKISISTFFPK